jgi:transcription elongation GreA/GreB family factor
MSHSLSRINKGELLSQIIAHLERELSVMIHAAKTAHEAATHEQARSEDKHDTRGIEAGYLAGAQAARVEELQRVIQNLRDFKLPKIEARDPIQSGTLIEAETDGRSVLYFLLSEGAAGVQLQTDQGQKINVITTRSPIGEALLDRRAGESTEFEIARKSVEIEILTVG